MGVGGSTFNTPGTAHFGQVAVPTIQVLRYLRLIGSEDTWNHMDSIDTVPTCTYI